jgi:hypothetical protein
MDIVSIEKINEVYNKIHCEPSIAYELNDYFTFDVPGAKFMPLVQNKIWDGKIRLFQLMTGYLYAGLNNYVEEFCRSRNYVVEYISDFASDEFSVIEAKEAIGKFKIPEKYYPRDYQLEAFIHAVRERRAFLVSPTASGKSLIIYLIMRYYAKRTLIIVPTTSLVSQLATDFADYGFKGYVHKITGGEEKDPIFVTFTCENGIKYTFDSNENIKIINSNIKYKKAKDITEDDEIDDRWLSK